MQGEGRGGHTGANVQYRTAESTTYLRCGRRMRVERVRRHHDGRGFVHFVIVMGVGRLRRRLGRLMVLGEVRAQRQRFGGTDDFQDLRGHERSASNRLL